jgi:hypothetical protein
MIECPGIILSTGVSDKLVVVSATILTCFVSDKDLTGQACIEFSGIVSDKQTV